MKSSIYVKRQSFEVRLNSVISFVFVAFCQPRILRYSARDVTDIFAMVKSDKNYDVSCKSRAVCLFVSFVKLRRCDDNNLGE